MTGIPTTRLPRGGSAFALTPTSRLPKNLVDTYALKDGAVAQNLTPVASVALPDGYGILLPGELTVSAQVEYVVGSGSELMIL